MTLKAPLRVHQSTASAGTGTYALTAPGGQFRRFRNAYTTGDKVPYVATDNLTNFEVGLGTLSVGATDTITRDLIISSSNGGAAVNWAAGTKDIFAFEQADSEYGQAFAGNLTLTGVEWSNIAIYTGTGGNTITLPALASVPLGFTVPCLNAGTGNLTGALPGGDSWQIGAAPVLAPQQSCKFVKGTTGWLVEGRIAGIAVSPFIIGTGTAAPHLVINGGASGTAAGPWILFQSGGVSNNAIGQQSAILGGAYDESLLIYSGAGATHFGNNGAVHGTVDGNGFNGTLGGTTPSAATVTTLTANTKVRTPLIDTASGDLVLQPASGGTSFIGSLTSISNNANGPARNYYVSNGQSYAIGNIGNIAASNFWITDEIAGAVRFGISSGSGEVFIGGNIGSEAARFVPVPNAVTRIEARGGATGVPPQFFGTGEPNTGLDFFTSGTGGFRFFTNGAVPQVLVNHTASADRFLTLTGANGGNPAVGTSAGDLKFLPATGIVQFGTYTAGVVAPTGTIQIRDAGGTLRTISCA